MSNQEVAVAKFTRKEFREALEAGRFGTAIIPTGSNEQHLEHLAMEYDIRAATHVATEAAKRLYPQVVVNVPMAVGISEHHMVHKGTVTAKPGSWLSVLFDAVESLVRHGVNNVLILNGHGGNEAPMMGILRQWQLFFQMTAPEANVQFHSYWNLSREIAEQHCTSRVPGHAGEYETAMAMVICPENIRHDAMQEQEAQEPLKANEELGKILVEGILRQWQLFFQMTAPEANVQFHSYWNLSREIAEQHCTSRVPGHAGEYETAMAMVICPENIRHDAMQEQEAQEPLKANEELGKILVEAAIQKTVEYLEGMIEAANREMQPHVFSKEMYAAKGKK